MLALMYNRAFVRLFMAQVIALLGTGLTTIALALLAYDLAGADSGLVLGTALAIKMVAAVAIPPLASSFMSRLPRRMVLISLDLVRAACVACLPFISEVWHIYVIIFFLNSASASFTPLFQTSIADLLPEEEAYTQALSLSRMAYDLENLLSPLLAALALLAFSYDDFFLVNAIAFLLSAALIMSVRLQTATTPEARNGWHGIVIYLKTPRLRGLLALSLSAAAGGAMVIVNSVGEVQGRLGLDDTATALAFAAAGAGSMLIALFLPRLLQRVSDRRCMLLGGGLISTGLLIASTGPDMPGLCGLWFVLGIGGAFIQTPAGRLLVRSCHEHDRPHLYAAQYALSHACWLVAYPVAGWTGSSLGIYGSSVILGSISGAGLLLAWRLWPAHDTQEQEHHHPELEHEHTHVHDDHHQHEHDGSEGPEPHSHPHRHSATTHRHPFVIDSHHRNWPE